MPLQKCTISANPGWKWGAEGKCYEYKPNDEVSQKEAKRKAILQGVAIGDFEAVGAHINFIKGAWKGAAVRTSFDFDGVLSTKRGQELWKNTEGEKFVITARSRVNSEEVYKITDPLQIPRSRVIFTGSNTGKINKIRELQITQHIDNNPDVVDRLPKSIGVKFRTEKLSYTDYPKVVQQNAQRALDFVSKFGWRSCGTPVGKMRANQLAKGEPISEDTISRMASFARHLQYDNKKLGDGCAKLMILAWGGKEGIEWASRKLQQIRNEGLAEVGPRGAIVPSKKAPASATPNTEPKGRGTAEGDASGKRGAEVSKRVEEILKNKADDFNKRYKDKLGYGVDIGMLKSVYQRGIGAFTVSHSPKVSSADQWALARVNAFLLLVKNGRPQNSKYVDDNDLLPKDHPKYSGKK